MAIIEGTDAADDIDGTDGDDNISGRGGDDRISGGDGDDRIFGGDGNDYLLGGNGNNFIEGGAGNDVIASNFGDDQLFGQDGTDVIQAGEGNDYVSGGSGDDVLRGGRGNDIVDGDDGDDRIYYQIGNDTIDGGADFDQLFADILSGTPVTFDANAGTLVSAAGAVNFTNIELFDIDLSRGTSEVTVRGGDGIEIFKTGAGNDRLEGGGGNDSLSAGEGNNYVDGGAGDDGISGGTGDDILLGGDGDDAISAEGGNDLLDGGDGVDRLSVSRVDPDLTGAVVLDPDNNVVSIGSEVSSIANFEQYYAFGALGDDTLIGGELDDRLTGRAGDDYLEGRGGDDFLSALEGNNYIDGGAGNDLIQAGDGDDIVLAGSGDDIIFLMGGSNSIDGGEGSDILYFRGEFSSEADANCAVFLDPDQDLLSVNGVESTIDNIESFVIRSGNADDILLGGTGSSTLIASAGSDRVEGGGSDDAISAFVGGSDVLLAGGGNDSVEYLSRTVVDGPVNAVLDGGEGDDRVSISLAVAENVLIDMNGGSITWEGGDVAISGFETIQLTSGSGDDQFFASGIATIFNGGAGQDEFYLPGNFDDYEITRFFPNAALFLTNPLGVEYASNAELFIFDDGVFDLATGDFTPSVDQNAAPEAVDDMSSADEDGETSGNLLGNDSDADGDPIEVTTVNGLPVGAPIQGLYGTLTVAADGYYSYVADGLAADRLADGTSGDDVFTYEVSDGEDSSTATLSITVSAISDGLFRVGTDGDDVLPGGDLDDVIEGLGGNDRLLGGDGDDLLDGGTGNDRLNGGDDDDYLIGGEGDDNLFGNDGDDVLVGGNGNDLMVGHAGADTFVVGGEVGSVDTIRDFEIGIDSLEFDGEAAMQEILQNAGNAEMTLSDGSSVVFAGISAQELAEIFSVSDTGTVFSPTSASASLQSGSSFREMIDGNAIQDVVKDLEETAQMDALIDFYSPEELAPLMGWPSSSNLVPLLDVHVESAPIGMGAGMFDTADDLMAADMPIV